MTVVPANIVVSPAETRVPARRALQSNLRASMIDGAAFSVMVGLGESYVAAFALAIGLGEVIAGLVTTLPLLAGSFLQLVSPWGVRRLGTHRRWVILCAACQGLSFVPLIAAAVAGHVSAAGILLIATIYWGTGQGAGPAWNTWIARVVPRRMRARYFAQRTRVSQAATLGGFVVGGIILHVTASHGTPLLGFVVLFVAAGAARLVSTVFLTVQSEPSRPPAAERMIRPLEFVRRLPRGEGRLLLYMFGVQLAAQIAGPYFTPYMLKQLHFSYGVYVALLATAFLSKIVTLPAFGRLAQRLGAHRLLWIGGVGIVPLSAVWIMTSSLPALFAVQIMAGIVWGAYELATFLLLFETIADDERTSVLTTFNVINAAAICAGALGGGLILKVLGPQPLAYMVLFGVSAVGRLVTLPLLRHVAGHPGGLLPGLRTLSIWPQVGSLDTPIVPPDGPRR